LRKIEKIGQKINFPKSEKTDSFEQLSTSANDPNYYKENLFFDQFSHFL